MADGVVECAERSRGDVDHARTDGESCLFNDEVAVALKASAHAVEARDLCEWWAANPTSGTDDVNVFGMERKRPSQVFMVGGHHGAGSLVAKPLERWVQLHAVPSEEACLRGVMERTGGFVGNQNSGLSGLAEIGEVEHDEVFRGVKTQVHPGLEGL